MVSEVTKPETQAKETGEPGDDEELVVELSAEDAKALGDSVESEKPQLRTYSEDEYRGLQKALSKKDAEISDLKAQSARLTRVEEGLGIILDYYDTLGGSGEALEVVQPPAETETQRRRREWKEKGQAQPDPASERERRLVAQFISAAQAGGVDLNDKEAQRFFGATSGPAEALEKLPEYAATRKKAEEARRKAESDKDLQITELRSQVDSLLERAGLKKVETGGPSASGGGTLTALNESYRKGEISYDEFRRLSEEIRKQTGG